MTREVSAHIVNKVTHWLNLYTVNNKSDQQDVEMKPNEVYGISNMSVQQDIQMKPNEVYGVSITSALRSKDVEETPVV